MSTTNQIIKNLETLKSKILTAGQNRARAEALRDQALERIKELGYDNITEAQVSLKEMQGDVTKTETELQQLIAKLHSDYPEL